MPTRIPISLANLTVKFLLKPLRAYEFAQGIRGKALNAVAKGTQMIVLLAANAYDLDTPKCVQFKVVDRSEAKTLKEKELFADMSDNFTSGVPYWPAERQYHEVTVEDAPDGKVHWSTHDIYVRLGIMTDYNVFGEPLIDPYAKRYESELEIADEHRELGYRVIIQPGCREKCAGKTHVLFVQPGNTFNRPKREKELIWVMTWRCQKHMLESEVKLNRLIRTPIHNLLTINRSSARRQLDPSRVVDALADDIPTRPLMRKYVIKALRRSINKHDDTGQ
ncbi:MAG: hypothetical protein KGL39_23940 [Patescibacteria group bacterium]|nr:hypothetical protein [Patescibacteria group bacterium]